MSYLLFFISSYIVKAICAEYNLDLPNDTVLIMLSILSGCEAIAWRCRK